MKVIEQYQRAVENSDELLLTEVVPTEKSVLVAAVDVAADDGYASGRSCRCCCPSS